MLVSDRRHVIRLMHRDAGLSIDVEAFDSFDTAEEYRDRLAGFLNLPPMMVAGAPAPRTADTAAAPQPRRSPARSRRPRFLTRRRPGTAEAAGKVVGREIIARN